MVLIIFFRAYSTFFLFFLKKINFFSGRVSTPRAAPPPPLRWETCPIRIRVFFDALPNNRDSIQQKEYYVRKEWNCIYVIILLIHDEWGGGGMEDICMILRESYIDIWYIGVISGILPANNVRTVAKFRNMTKKAISK